MRVIEAVTTPGETAALCHSVGVSRASLYRRRRAQARHPVYAAPELVATRPNQVLSWDITKLKGPIPYLYYSLYVILDLFSRYAVGWMVARQENAHLAERLIAATCRKQGIAPHQLTIHADRGAPMRSKLVALLFSDLGIAASHSRHRTRLAAYAAHPERFVQGPPRPETLPTAVWVNRPPKPTREDAPGATPVTPDDPQHGVIRRSQPIRDDRPITLVTIVGRYSRC